MTDNSKTNRDLYLQYVRMENPDYDLYTREEARAFVAEAPKPTPKKESNKPKTPYCCSTQEHEGMAEIYLGIERGRLHLWENGSIINWTARRDGWPDDRAARQALTATWHAASAWNEVMDGRVRFRYVSSLSDAAIELRFDGGGRDGLLASAFFPNDWRRDLSFLRVYRSSFDSRYRSYPLYNTMLHEFGHILGLRHEFAHESEGQAESILFGIKNSRSVMAYYPAQEIQDSDAEFIRRAYDELDDGERITGKGPFGTIVKTVARVAPNN